MSMWTGKRYRTRNTILKEKKVGELTLLDFKVSLKIK